MKKGLYVSSQYLFLLDIFIQTSFIFLWAISLKS